MGNENAINGVAAGIAATLLVGGFQLLHDSDARQESNHHREADAIAAKEAAAKEEIRFVAALEAVQSIQKNVEQTVQRRILQPLVVASDVFDQQFDFAANSAAGSTTTECDRAVLLVTNLGDQAALDVSVVWMIEGHPITVAVPHCALAVNGEITSSIVPKLISRTKVTGYVKIEYGDSYGFRGVVEHPVSIRSCDGHVHVTVEPHSYQTWGPSASFINTN